MRYKLTAPKKMQSTLHLPASKSISGRALIINALSRSLAPLDNVSDCDDTCAMLTALESKKNVIDVGAAGTAMRFLTAFFSITPGERVLTGTERMQHRPIKILVDALRALGADIRYEREEGFPPVRIMGKPLHGGELTLSGSVSSQYISALLMIGALLRDGLILHLEGNIVSVPYINMTLQLMNQFGGKAAWVDECTLKVEAIPYKETPFLIENDWSAASYWYELMALTPDAEARVCLPGLFEHSVQGDARVAEMFRIFGVETSYGKDGITLRKTKVADNDVTLDLKDQPDLAQTLVCTCLALKRKFHFSGLSNLKIKETDRLQALCVEAAKLGYLVREENKEALVWDGEQIESDANPVIATYEDHRMAMAFAPMALTRKNLLIDHPQVVSKSYPHFWEDLSSVGFTIEEI